MRSETNVIDLQEDILDRGVGGKTQSSICVNEGGAAFGFRPNAWVCDVKSGLQLGEATALFRNQSDVNNCCRKNGMVAPRSWPLAAAGTACVATPEFAI